MMNDDWSRFIVWSKFIECCMMNDEWWIVKIYCMMNDEWWMMNDEWWMIKFMVKWMIKFIVCDEWFKLLITIYCSMMNNGWMDDS